MRKIRFYIITCFLILQTTHLCLAASDVMGVPLRWRVGNTDFDIFKDNEKCGTRYNINNDQTEVCSVPTPTPTPTHIHSHTTLAGRRFEHIHVTFSIPAGGYPLYDRQGVSLLHTITVAEINAYWDFHYGKKGPPGTRIGGMSYARNCWGYAFDYDCWIEKPQYIYEDNYDQAPINPSAVPQGEFVYKVTNDHAQKLTNLNLTIPLFGFSIYHMGETAEKNQESGIYKRFYSVATGPQISSIAIYIKK